MPGEDDMEKIIHNRIKFYMESINKRLDEIIKKRDEDHISDHSDLDERLEEIDKKLDLTDTIATSTAIGTDLLPKEITLIKVVLQEHIKSHKFIDNRTDKDSEIPEYRKINDVLNKQLKQLTETANDSRDISIGYNCIEIKNIKEALSALINDVWQLHLNGRMTDSSLIFERYEKIGKMLEGEELEEKTVCEVCNKPIENLSLYCPNCKNDSGLTIKPAEQSEATKERNKVISKNRIMNNLKLADKPAEAESDVIKRYLELDRIEPIENDELRRLDCIKLDDHIETLKKEKQQLLAEFLERLGMLHRYIDRKDVVTVNLLGKMIEEYKEKLEDAEK